MKINIHKDIFIPKHYPIIKDFEHRIILMYGGGSSGKSFFAFQRAVYKALLEPNRKTLIVRKTAVNCRRSCFEDVKRTLSQFGVLKYCKVNKSTMEITFPNGSCFLFMGLDNFENIKSIPDINDIIIEECSEITLDDFSELKHRTRGKGKLHNQIVMMMNPVSKANWTYKHFFENGCQEDNCLIVHSTYKDNPFCNDDTVKALEDLRKTNEPFYNIYCLGQFGSLDKLVFNNWQTQDFNHLDIKGELLVGVDFGFVNDATTIISSILDEANKRIYIFDEFYEHGLLNDAIAEEIKRKGLAKSTIIADSAEQKSIEEIKRAGVYRIKPAVKGAGSILQGIQKLQQYELVVHPSCVNVIEELQNYSWKKDKNTNEYINEPIDKYNHCIDALRYSLQCVGQKLQTATKQKWGF